MFSGLARAICELNDMSAILQYQVIKQSDAKLVVYLKLHNEVNKDELMKKYKEECRKNLGELIDVDIIPIDYISPDEKIGKTKEFIDKT